MREPIVAVKCIRCGTPCLGCICAPCPNCVPMICSSCPLELSQVKLEHGPLVLVQKEPYTVIARSRDCALQPGARPVPRVDEKEPDRIVLVSEHGFSRGYQSEELIWDDARVVAGALKTIFFFCFAGVVAGSAAVMFAAAAVFSGEVPE